MLKLRWPFEHKIISVAPDGKFGRYGYYDKLAGFPHQGSDYKIRCNIKWYWPLAGTIDLFEKRNYGYGYYSRIKATNGYYFGVAHNNEIAGYKGKKVKVGDYGGKVGNTGLGSGCHSHIELRNPQGKVVDLENVVKWVSDMYKGKNAESWYKSFKHALSVATTRSNRFGVIAKQLAKDLNKPIPKPDSFKTILSYLDLFITKKAYEEALQYAQDQYEKVSGDRLTNHNIEIELLEDEISDLEMELEGLKEEIKTFKEPKGPKIPRITKFDNLWDKAWKWLLQQIAR